MNLQSHSIPESYSRARSVAVATYSSASFSQSLLFPTRHKNNTPTQVFCYLTRRRTSMTTFTISNNGAAKWPLPQFDSSHFSPSSPVVLRHSLLHVSAFRIHCIPPEPLLPVPQITHDQHSFGGGGGRGDGDAGGGGGGGGGDRDGGGDEEFGPLLNFEAVMRESEARGVQLPPDMVEAARVTGIREMFLLRYMELQVGFL